MGLNPDFLAGQHRDFVEPHSEREGRTLYNYKDVQRGLHMLADGDLKRIVVLPEGGRLEQGATYLDLRDENTQPFTVTGGIPAGRENLIVPKANVSYVRWNQLIGVDELAQLDEATGTPPSVSGQT